MSVHRVGLSLTERDLEPARNRQPEQHATAGMRAGWGGPLDTQFLSGEYIRTRAGRSPRTGRLPEIDFRVANVEDLPFADDAFNVAVVNYCAYDLARPKRAFSESRRGLGHGGRLAVIHPIQLRQPSWGSFADAVSAVLPPETVTGGGLLDAADPEVYVELLQDCGYVSVACEVKKKPVALAKLDISLEGGWIITDLHEQPRKRFRGTACRLPIRPPDATETALPSGEPPLIRGFTSGP